MNVGKIEFSPHQDDRQMEILELEAKIRQLKACVRWYRAFMAQSSPIKSKSLLYLAQRAEEAYRSAQ
jgi:hypothetical protein